MEISKHKYKKYKTKYLKLKQLTEGYYLVHGSDLPHLKKALIDGYIYSGKYLPDSETRLGGWEKLPYVYCNIYFDDIKNLPYSHGYTYVLHPFIIKSEGIIFNKGWQVNPTKDSIIVKPNDPDYDAKMAEIKSLVENPTYLHKINGEIRTHPFMHHEILIKDKIDLHKYLIALILPGVEGIQKDNMQKLLENEKYTNVKIFAPSSDLPPSTDLV